MFAAVLAVIGFVLPLLIPIHGLDTAGYVAVVARDLLWLLAFMVLLATGVGAFRRRLDRARFDSGRSIDSLSWGEFEGYLAEYFRRRGGTVIPRGGPSADGGVDLVIEDVSGRRIVQAKHWRSRSVGVMPLRALWGVLEDERAQGAVFVTSGTFTPDALRFAEGKRLELIDGMLLTRLINEVREVKTVAGSPVPSPQTNETCPQCSRGRLVQRLARRGSNAGSFFLACDRYPDCRYTRNV